MPTTDPELVKQIIAHHRARKALALADFLSGKGISVAVAGAFDEARRRAAEDMAGVRVASDETWAVVLAILQRRARTGDVIRVGVQ